MSILPARGVRSYMEPCKEPARPQMVAWGKGNVLGEFTLTRRFHRPSASVAGVERLVAYGDTLAAGSSGGTGQPRAGVRLKRARDQVRSVRHPNMTVHRRPSAGVPTLLHQRTQELRAG